MEGKNKDFNNFQAEKLLLVYQSENSASKAMFLQELISCNKNFGAKSIVNQKLILKNSYSHETAESVICDLGFKLKVFDTKVENDLFGQPKNHLSIIVIN